MARITQATELDLETDYTFLCRKGPYEFWLFVGTVDEDLGYQGRILSNGDLVDTGEVFTLPHEAIDNIMAKMKIPSVVYPN